jgi:hypothetical protein
MNETFSMRSQPGELGDESRRRKMCDTRLEFVPSIPAVLPAWLRS